MDSSTSSIMSVLECRLRWRVLRIILPGQKYTRNTRYLFVYIVIYVKLMNQARVMRLWIHVHSAKQTSTLIPTDICGVKNSLFKWYRHIDRMTDKNIKRYAKENGETQNTFYYTLMMRCLFPKNILLTAQSSEQQMDIPYFIYVPTRCDNDVCNCCITFNIFESRFLHSDVIKTSERLVNEILFIEKCCYVNYIYKYISTVLFKKKYVHKKIIFYFIIWLKIPNIFKFGKNIIT